MASSGVADARPERTPGPRRSAGLWKRLLPSAKLPAGRPGAIVIGGDYRGLGIVRSLGRHRIPVWVLTDEHLVAAASRYAQRSLEWPRSEEDQIETLLDLADNGTANWVVFPTADKSAAVLARNHAELSKKLRLTVPDWSVFHWAHDKKSTYELAGSLSLAHPWTRYPHDIQEVQDLACPFPVILKPATKELENRFTHEKAWRVDDREALLARYKEASALVPAQDIMLQEFIPGGGDTQYSFAALCEDGRPLASVAARRIRQFPREVGLSSSYIETVDCPPVEEAAVRLLQAMHFTGLVEVEFKYDSREQSYKLLDVNPRIWGWHSVGRRAGVDFPYLLWRHINGETFEGIRGRAGVRWVRAVTDVPVVAQDLLSGRLGVGDYIRSLRGPVESAIWAADDPAPALLEVPILGYLAWKRKRSH